MSDDLVERLRDWPYQGETIALQAAAEITRLRSRVAELEADLAYTNKRLEHAFERNDRQAQTIDALTVALATAREDALEEAAKWLRGGAHLPYPMLADEMILAMKDAKP
jgi:chromosome segregation ATPase